ncbi:MAG: hypothetical protein K6B43_02415 [Treponema sp.]|nr:hypothetical protein [Treponema sp.]
MGSRGQALETGGFTAYNYKTLIRIGNTRFVMQKESGDSVKSPEMSNSPWAVYATISKSGELQSISFFNGGRKKYKEIDFLHAHKKLTPHTHIIDPNSLEMRSKKDYRTLTTREKNYVEKIKNFFTQNNVKDLYDKEKSR